MNEKYSVNELNICTFKIENGKIKTNLNEYPQTRLCVIDKENNFAIDVRHKLKYDYIETVSGLYFVSCAFNKIRNNRRVAVFPLVNLGITKEERLLVNDVIDKLESGYQFQDGNSALTNEEYLGLIEKENASRIQPMLVKRKK